jgi:DNA-binding NarL/FixJ family response regulator
MKILIADDHPIVRHGLRQILADSNEVSEVGEAASEADVLRLLRQQAWDVLVLDLAMPGRGGLETLKVVRAEWPRLPILILTMYPEDQYAVRALRAGADGYLSKESAAERLLEALRKVNGGGKYVSERVAERLAVEIGRPKGEPPHEALSDRELQVLVLVGSGRTVGEIAEQLALSVKTVSTYRARILEKTGLRNNAELMQYVIEHKLARAGLSDEP